MSETIPRTLIAGTASATRRGSLYRMSRRRSTVAFLFALPLLTVIGGLIVYPGIYAV